MTTEQVAKELVAMCREGKFHEAIEKFYGDDIVSIEAFAPPGQSREMKGLAAVKAKGKWWMENHEVHSCTVGEPLVAGPYFSTTFTMDVTFKPENRKMHMDEIAVYEVRDGKVVWEQFFYPTSPQSV